MSHTVSILGFLSDETYLYLQSQLAEQLDRPYHLDRRKTQAEFLAILQQPAAGIDCILLEKGEELTGVITALQERSLLYPALILSKSSPSPTPSASTLPLPENSKIYHPAEVHFELVYQLRASPTQSGASESPNPPAPEPSDTHPALLSNPQHLSDAIDQALKQFLSLSPKVLLQESPDTIPTQVSSTPSQTTLRDQQQELAEKLRERLGYMGIYYKRDSRHFLRNLPPEDVAEILSSLKEQYQAIVLKYFLENTDLNPLIDEFVNTAFFTDIPVTKIVEIHMELMDDYSKQLKLEGRSEEILVDYRLTLLDIVAHLCEMYRRSIPRES